MLLSPEEILCLPIPYAWPPTSGFDGLVTKRSSPDTRDIVLYPLDSPWKYVVEDLLDRLRARRFRKIPTDFADSLSHGGSEPPCIATVLYLVNHGGFFKAGTPALKAIMFTTAIEHCLAISLVLAGPTEKENVTWTKPGQKPLHRWDNKKKCLCMVFLLPPGFLDRTQWKNKRPLPRSQPCMLLPEVMKHCELRQTTRAALTDGRYTVIISRPRPQEGPLPIEYEFVAHEPVPLSVASLIYIEATASKLIANIGTPQHWCLGALNAPSVPLPPLDVVLARSSMSAFDLYTMQRDRRHWDQFLQWKASKVEQAEAHPHHPGEVLLGEMNSFVRRIALLRSPLVMPEIPSETTMRILPGTRPRDEVATRITSGSDGHFSFKVVGAMQVGREKYSQVLSGVVTDGNAESDILCVKLYDERLFPMPHYNRRECDPFYWSEKDKARDRLLTWNVAVDLVRREEAAYNRLKAFQGSLLPYSYGFHEFQLPDGHTCFGFLMERVEGVSLVDINLKSLPDNVQAEFVLTVRHCLRVLRYAQIQQTDWHFSQFLIRPSSSSKQEAFDVVFIDFAFALQHTDALYTPPTRDWIECRNLVWNVLERPDLIQRLWFPPDENEL